MKCPVDGATLVMTERAGVEIDYCPECRGVWLDRGELDKIVQHASGDVMPMGGGREYREERSHERRTDDYGHRDDHRDEYRYDNDTHGSQHYGDNKKKRRGSFLEDVFGGFGD